MSVQGLIPGTKDYGISENKYLQMVAPWLKQINNPAVVQSQTAPQVLGTNTQSPAANGPVLGPVYNGPQGKASGGSVGSTNQVPAGMQTRTDAINNQVSSGNNQIDQDYQNYLSTLSGQESSLRAEAPVAEQRVESMYAPVKSDIQYQGKQKIGGLEGQATTVNTQKATQLQQARDLFRQIQQQNIAQLSGTGISSSSVAEALAENLGVETAKRIASVSQSADDVIRGIEKEKTNVNDYVNTKLTEVDQTIATEKLSIQQKLRAGLDQINNARQLAANDKASRRQDLLTNAQNAISELQAKAQDFAQSLQMWQQQTTSGLSAAANKDWSTIFSGMAENAPAINGFTFTPSVDVSQSGYKVSGQYQKNAKDQNDIYSQYGITPTQ